MDQKSYEMASKEVEPGAASDSEKESRSNGNAVNGKRTASPLPPSHRVKRKVGRPRMRPLMSQPPIPPPSPVDKKPIIQVSSCYQAQAVLLLLLRLRGIDLRQRVAVLRDETSGAVTLALSYLTGGGLETAELRVHIISAGRDDVDTRCLLSCLNYSTREDTHTHVEFTSFDVSALNGIMEPCEDRTPLQLRLFRFLPNFCNRGQLVDMLMRGGLLTMEEAEDYISKVRLASSQPDHSEIEGVIRQQIGKELRNEEHVDAMYLNLVSWVTRWVNDCKPNEFVSKSDLDKIFRDFKSELSNLHFEVHKPDDNFYAREDEVMWVQKILQSRGAELIDAVISGVAGVGKTELVRKYLQLHGHIYDRIVVLAAHSKDALTASLQRAARLYSLESCTDLPTLISRLYESLRGRKSLLVFESVDTLASIEDLLSYALPGSRSGAPTIVVTSRQSSWIIRNVLLLSSFTQPQACAFLRRNFECETELLEQLSDCLSCLPLSLQVSSACLTKEIEAYKVLGKSGQAEKKIVAYVKRAKEMPDSLWIQVRKTVSRAQHGAVALTLLEVAALMGGDHFEVSTFLLLPELYTDNEDDKSSSRHLGAAVSLLQSFCLLKVTDGVANLQRLTSDHVLASLREDPQSEIDVIDTALAMARNDSHQNKESIDSNLNIFTPRHIYTWVQVFNDALKYGELVVKYSSLVPMLMYDVFHKIKSESQIQFATGVFTQLIDKLESHSLIVSSDEALKSLKLAKLEIARRICMSNMTSDFDGAFKGIVNKHLAKYGDDAFMLFSML